MRRQRLEMFLLWVFIRSAALLCGVQAFTSAPTRTRTSLRNSPCVDSNDINADSETMMIAEKWIQSFSAALCVAGNGDAVVQHFVQDKTPFWRDMVALSWNIITLEGKNAIENFCNEQDETAITTTRNWKLDPSRQFVSSNSNTEFWSTFETSTGTGRAHVRLEQKEDGEWKAATLLTVLSALTDRPWKHAPHQRPMGTLHGPTADRQYFHEQTTNDASSTYVAIVGGGQGGLSLAARLQRLQIPYIVIESGTTPGSSWRKRYPSLCLHDPAYYNHMPYLPFPKTWPLFCPRDKIADWMKLYAIALDLKVQTNSRVERAVREGNDWKIEIKQRDPSNNEQSSSTINAKHIVFCTGNASSPRVPAVPGKFGGLQLHSSQYKGGKEYEKHNIRDAVVVGSNNSAFDIAQDLWEQLASKGLQSISMIQRTPSMVVSTESVLKHGLGPLYSENAALCHEEADLVATTVPYKLAMEKWKRVTRVMAETDAKLLEGVARAGFRLDSGPDGTGIFAKSATEGGGFYINVGCAELLERGDVLVRYATIDRLEDNAIFVRNKDTGISERISADLIVYATGFDTMERRVSEICGEEVAKKVGRIWGLGLGHKPKDPGPWEGELRNMWKPTTVEGLWLQGGNLAQNRHYSRFLALQLAARFMGVETTVYGTPTLTSLVT